MNNVPGNGERLFEVNFLKSIFAIAHLQIKTYLNRNDPDHPKNANIEFSIDEHLTCTGDVTINGILPNPQ